MEPARELASHRGRLFCAVLTMKQLRLEQSIRITEHDGRPDIAAFGVGPDQRTLVLVDVSRPSDVDLDTGWAVRSEGATTYRLTMWDALLQRRDATLEGANASVSFVQPIGDDIRLISPRCEPWAGASP